MRVEDFQLPAFDEELCNVNEKKIIYLKQKIKKLIIQMMKSKNI